jgi:trimethylamine-N-oxide reductase (cytochrome c)
MIRMMAMQGWGKPGVNFGCLGVGVPHDLDFYESQPGPGGER